MDPLIFNHMKGKSLLLGLLDEFGIITIELKRREENLRFLSDFHLEILTISLMVFPPMVRRATVQRCFKLLPNNMTSIEIASDFDNQVVIGLSYSPV